MAKTKSEDVIFRAAFVAAAFLLLPLKYEKIGGNQVPTFVFRRPIFFHVFLMLVALAFSASFVTISLRDRLPKFAGVCRRLALGSAAMAAGVFAVSLLLPLALLNNSL